MEDHQKEVVVVTGASAGLGRAIANEFARHGARVALIARGKERLEQAKKEVEELGGEAVTFSVDVSDAKQLDAAAALVEEKWGPIDIWINNAMVGMLCPVKDMKPEEFKRVTDVTYHGQVYGTMAALKRMLPRDKGTIVLIGSALAYRGIPLQAAYCGAKHATQGFLDSLRSELLHDKSNVKISMVQMPAINTPQFDWVRNKMSNKARPMGTPYLPEVCAKEVYYAAHHPEREYKVGVSSFVTVLGNKLFPGVGDWYLGKTGFKGQQTNEPNNEERPDNLFEPAPGEYGAHGRFDEESKNSSATRWITRHQSASTAAALVVGAALTAFLFRS